MEKKVPGLIAWPLRITGLLLPVSVLAQPVWAGLFLTGDVAMLAVHELNAQLVSYLAFAHLLLCVLAWRPARRSPLGIWVTLAFVALTWLQYDTGLTRELQLHFPGGVLLAVLAAGIGALAWRTVRPSRPSEVGGA